MFFHNAVDQVNALAAQHALLCQDLAQRAGLGKDPDVHGSNELVAHDEIELERKNSEEQVAVGGHVTPGRVRWRNLGCPILTGFGHALPESGTKAEA